MINLKLTEYALMSISRHKWKHLFIYTVLTLLIAVAMSLFSITSGLKKEAEYSLNNLPDIVVQRISGGRQQYIHTNSVNDIILIHGVTSAAQRVWGFYDFDYLNTNITIVGIDIYDPFMSKTLVSITDGLDLNALTSGGILVGNGFKNIVNSIYGKDEFSFQKPDGKYLTLPFAGVFKPVSQMISADTIIMDIDIAREILGIPESYGADIAVNVANPQEISTVQEKIENMSPALKVTTKEVIRASYQNMFDYKGGIFLLFFISAVLTFFMIVFDKLSGLSGAEVREIAILKSVGWSTSDVLKVKIYESVIISITAYVSAILASGLYVFILNAPGLRDIFMGYAYLKPQFDIVYTFFPVVYVSSFFLTVPLYIAAVIIPAWRASSTDPGEVIR